MRSPLRGLAAYGLLAFAPSLGFADPPKVDPGRKAVERGLDFIRKDAAKWKADRQCSTCHHGVMTVWALCEAKSRGYDVTKDELAETVKWTKDRLDRLDLPRDTRPGWSMVNTPALYLSAMALSIPNQVAIPPAETKRIVGHLLRHQEADGSWSWASAPAKNRPPPAFESDEVATRLAYLALGSVSADERKEKAEARDKAAEWLAKAAQNDTTQAAGLRLLMKLQTGEKKLQPDIDGFLARQNKDGGWGQIPNAVSDAYGTGQALYFLSLAGVALDKPEVLRGVAFLAKTQKDDGSWPMVSRSHPGVEPMKNPVPITYFGSAWGTLGLLRSVKP